MSEKPGSGWHFQRYGRKVAVFAIPRIRDWRLHGRVHLGGDGFGVGVWWMPQDNEYDDGDVTIAIGPVSIVFWLAHFYPHPHTLGDTDA